MLLSLSPQNLCIKPARFSPVNMAVAYQIMWPGN